MTKYELAQAPSWCRQLIRAMDMDPDTVEFEIATPVRTVLLESAHSITEHTGQIEVTVRGNKKMYAPRDRKPKARGRYARRK
jgi:hypothetical protein